MKTSKKNLIISGVAIVLIIVLVVGATYAYFAAQTGDPASTGIKITTATVDSLTFSTGDAISLSATQSNFGTGSASLSDSTSATATLVPNNSTNSADATYYLYVKIGNNDFSYTTDDSTAELILSITDPDGNAVTSLSGLTYTTVIDNQGTSYSGFDVTTTKGIIAIAELYSIVADGGTKVDDWTITLTFVNLSTDQSANAGSIFEASVIIQADKLQSGAEALIAELYTTDGDNNLYYMDGTGTYADYEVTDYSYRFSGSSDSVNNFVCFGSDSDTCETDNLYRIIGFFLNDDGEYEMKLIKWDYANSDLLGTDGDYSSDDTYSASSYSNYTGSHNTINRYYWSYVNYSAAYSATGYYNDWAYSQLNTVNLNTNYYNSLDSKWQDMITTHTWSVGGGSSSSSAGVYATAKVGYSYEIENPSDQLGYTTYSAKVGLMYVSDYGFAVDPSYWNVETYNYDTAAYAADWLYGGITEWTISRSSSYDTNAFFVSDAGYVASNTFIGFGRAVRPVLYLISSVSIVNGGGTISNPYRLQI